MKLAPAVLFVLLPLLLLVTALGNAASGSTSQVLAIVGDERITSHQLESAMASAPFATQFATMDVDDQAALRGDMLVRLVNSEILYQEALQQGLDKSPDFLREMSNFRTGLLYQRYQYAMRDTIKMAQDQERKLRESLKENPDAISAARASYVAGHYDALKRRRLDELRRKYELVEYPEWLPGGQPPEAVLVSGDGIEIVNSDLPAGGTPKERTESLQQLTEVLLMARAALDEGIDVDAQVLEYRRSLLAQLLLKRKEQEWIPNRATLRDYFQRHPDIGYIPELRQTGQIVVSTRKQAEALRKRILNGESLFVLAGEYTIDPYGKEHLGDMGWLKAGSGMPQIEAALQTLADGEVSEVIETPKGFHLVMIVTRKPGETQQFSAIEDQVRRAVLQENMTPYMAELMTRHPVQWTMADHAEE